MPHRALQIIDDLAAALAANTSLGADVFKHRRLTLNLEEGELPAVSVRMGDDDPAGPAGVDNMAFIDSLLVVAVDALVQIPGGDESAVIDALLELRRQIHITLQSDITQGLSFVSDTRYGGAAEPTISTDGSHLAGLLTSRWVIRYRMNQADPA